MEDPFSINKIQHFLSFFKNICTGAISFATSRVQELRRRWKKSSVGSSSELRLSFYEQLLFFNENKSSSTTRAQRKSVNRFFRKNLFSLEKFKNILAMKKKKNKMKYRRQESSEREEKILNKRLFFLYLFIFSSTQQFDPFRDFDIRGIARFSTQFPLPIICRDHHILRKSRFDARSTRLLA